MAWVSPNELQEKEERNENKAYEGQPNATRPKISSAWLGILSLGFLGCLKPGNTSGPEERREVHFDASIGALTGSKPLSVVAG